MQESAKQIYESSSILTVEGEIASVKEVFRLQGVSELKEAEENYLPKKEIATEAIILAASRGEAMGSLTDNQPKAMIPLKDKSILEHISIHIAIMASIKFMWFEDTRRNQSIFLT